MLDFLKRLLGLGGDSGSGYSRPRSEARTASNRYFDLLQELQNAKRDQNWEKGAAIARELLDVTPKFVRESKQSYGDVPPNLPLFTDGARALAMTGDDVALENLRALTHEIPALAEWRPAAEEALVDRDLVSNIRRLVAKRAGILQTDVKEAIGAEDGRKLATLLRQLEEGGELQRIRYKRTYVLGPPGADVPLPEDHPAHSAEDADSGSTTHEVATTFDSDHQRRKALKAREVRLDDLTYIPLPRAPLKWEGKHKKSAGRTEAEDMFELGEKTLWKIRSVDKLPMEERPDTAYRKLAPHAAGTFLIDDLGKAQRFPNAPAALLSVGQSGDIMAEASLGWGLYRWQVNPMGSGFIAMDDKGVAHAYDHQMRRLFATSLAEAPEMPELMARYDFDRSSLKNHTRTVALAPDGSHYLFTVVDCGYVIEADGSPAWALQLPKQEGWERVATVSRHAGTSAQVHQAMRILELRPPVALEDVRRSYRRLAKEWHPDVNRGSEEAEERFKAISNAAELLSGLELSSLAPDVERPVYRQVDHETTFEVEGMQVSIQVSMQTSEKQASDWMYAASFAHDGGAFFAGYSGRVVRTDPRGAPLRAYDIGAVPRRIVDTGDYLYFLTDTRLYILRDEGLVRLLDVFEEGELVLGQTGFGLLEKKRFRWFTEEGDLVGSVLTNNPIRRVHSTPTGLVVETRQRRAEIAGAPVWWED